MSAVADAALQTPVGLRVMVRATLERGTIIGYDPDTEWPYQVKLEDGRTYRYLRGLLTALDFADNE